jgi:olefin beta-lactone synthetase
MNENFNIVDLFYRAAAKHPYKIALIEEQKKITFGDFEKEVTSTAQYFLEKGIRQGDRVLVFVPMSIDLYRTVLAIFRIGATAVFLDEWVGKERMEACCRIAECKGFIGSFKARILSVFSSEIRKIPIHLSVHFRKGQQEETFAKTSMNDTALITFTTGSTGNPKAARRTHGFLNEQFKALQGVLQPGENDVSMPALPIVLLLNLGAGITSVITRFKAGKLSSLKPEKLVRQIRDHAVNTIIASPFFVRELSKYLIKNNILVSQIDRVFTGGAPVFPQEASTYRQAFKNARIEIVYGSTEAEPISSIDARELISGSENSVNQGLHVGSIDKSAKVKIISITDDPISLQHETALAGLEKSQGEIGEIIVSGSHVLREYLNDDKALERNKIFVNGDCWHRTGDSGYLDADGSLFLTGRCSTLISRDQDLICPFVYEGYFQSLNGVEMGTISLVHNNIMAIIELNEQSERHTVKQAIKSLSISPDVIFIKRIPRDPRHHSKIDYEKLKMMLIKHRLLIG